MYASRVSMGADILVEVLAIPRGRSSERPSLLTGRYQVVYVLLPVGITLIFVCLDGKVEIREGKYNMLGDNARIPSLSPAGGYCADAYVLDRSMGSLEVINDTSTTRDEVS